MNTLSWLIYAAEVAGNMRGVAIAAVVFSTVGIGGAAFLFGMQADFGDAPAGSWKKPFGYVWVPVVLALLAAATPTTRTIYLIAASEAGETVVASPEAIEMFGDLKAIIKKRLADELAQ